MHPDHVRAEVVKRGAQIGIALDGDADRIGVVDERGRFVPPLQVFALLALHLLRGKGWRGAIARTFANTLLAERIARHHGVPFHDLPVGFKHIARLMREEDVLIGGEESGGIGVKRYLPERDGILIGLLLLEMLSAGERRLSRRIAAMQKEFGAYDYRRVDLHLPPGRGAAAVDRLRQDPPATLAGQPIRGLDTLDGVDSLPRLRHRTGPPRLLRSGRYAPRRSAPRCGNEAHPFPRPAPGLLNAAQRGVESGARVGRR
jgi:phosphomannomutase